jgi:hypothetical protein
MLPRTLPWVPFPEPGAPKIKYVRYFIVGMDHAASRETVKRREIRTKTAADRRAGGPETAERGEEFGRLGETAQQSGLSSGSKQEASGSKMCGGQICGV